MVISLITLSQPVSTRTSGWPIFSLWFLLTATVPGQSEIIPGSASPLALPAVRSDLREFDRFLDHHPLLEDQLRLDPKLTSQTVFLVRNLELGSFLKAHAGVAQGLSIYPRYYLNRALLRQANAPLSFHDLAPLKAVFQEDPKVERALIANPALIRDPVFLAAHLSLRVCLEQHPALGRVYPFSHATLTLP
jgi:hypothetical protein